MMRPAFFFDRDGVVNVSPGAGYVLRWEDFHFCEGVIEALAWLKKRGFALVLVTNQQGVGKGLMTQAALDDMHHRMQQELARHGAAFDAIHACTCLKSNPSCTCHKPSPEMVLAAAKNLQLDLAQSWLIGDQDRDIQMAISAGVPHTVRVTGEHECGVEADHIIKDMSEFPALLKSLTEGV